MVHLAQSGTLVMPRTSVATRWRTQASLVIGLIFARFATKSLVTRIPSIRRRPARRRKPKPKGLNHSPPDSGVQAVPRPVLPKLDVEHEVPLPLSGPDDDLNAFVFYKPVDPDIKVSSLKPAMFYLPDHRIFLDKLLPDPEPCFSERIVPHSSCSPQYFTALHKLVSDPGENYRAGTYNYKGARISLAHSKLNIPTWRKLLVEYSRKEIVDFLEFGFPIGVDPSSQTEPTLKNHSSSYMFYTYLDKFCIKEITNTGMTGPFGSAPFPYYQLSPLMTTHKKPNGRRCVFDASFGTSLNKITPHDHYLDYRAEYDYPKLDDLEAMILKVGKGARIWKRDLSRYFLQLPLDPVDYWRTGFIWRQNFFFFTSYMFGLRHSGWAGQAVTSAVTWMHRRFGLEDGDEEFNTLNYSDDLAGCEEGSRADVSFERMGSLLGDLGLDEAADKATPPSTRMEYLGITFDTIALKKFVPPAKLAELKDLLFTWLRKSVVTKRSMQSLTGKLLWVARCVQHSRCFLSRLLAGLRSLSEQHHKLTLTEEMRLDILWWYTYICKFNGVDFIVSPSTITQTYAGDACLFGGGGYHGSQYWSRRLPDWMCGEKPPIHLKEFYVLLISIRTWGPSWSGQTVQLFCDNTAVVEVCTRQKPRDLEMAKFLREFLLLVVTYKFYPLVSKIGTKENWCADFISRVFDPLEHKKFFHQHKMSPLSPVYIPDSQFSFTAAW